MNKKPILLRSFFALVVLGVFLFSMYPLGQTDFYASMKSMFVNPGDPKIEEVCKLAKAKQEADKSMYASTAIEEAAREKGVLLTDYVKPRIVKSQSLTNNRDVLAHARKLSAGSIRLGIDLNGGAEFLLELEPNETGSDAAQKRKDIENNFERYRDVAIETLRTRLESENIFESEISPAGGNLISLRVPIVSKEEKSRLERLIKMSARLSFSLVHPENDKLVQAYLADPENFTAPEGYKMMENAETGRGGKVRRGIYFVEREAQMDGKDISDAFPTMSQFGQREIILNFNPAGAQRFGEVTSKNVGRKLAIILDNVLYSAPNIQHAITGGTAQITGDFSREDAETISKALVSGSVPFKVKVQAVRHRPDHRQRDGQRRSLVRHRRNDSRHDLHGGLLHAFGSGRKHLPDRQRTADARRHCRVRRHSHPPRYRGYHPDYRYGCRRERSDLRTNPRRNRGRQDGSQRH